MDEIYIKINGAWVYLYRPFVSLGNTIEIVEQDHIGFKSFHSAKTTITGIENIHITQKRQILGYNDRATTF